MDSFESHTKTEHGASIANDQIPLLIDVCKRSTFPEIQSCPLCDLFPSNGGEVDKEMLLDHIATEIHSFSLLALPWADDNEQETKERMDHSTDKVYEWLVKYKLSDILDKERPPYEMKVCLYDHFERNPYFAGSSNSSSDSNAQSIEDQSLTSVEKELEEMKQQEPWFSVRSRNSDVSPSEATITGDKPSSSIRTDEAVITENDPVDSIATQGPTEDFRQALNSILFSLERGHPDELTCRLLIRETRDISGNWTIEKMEERMPRVVSSMIDYDPLTSLNNLAALLRFKKHWEEAEVLCLWVLDAQSNLRGREHPSTLNTMANLAILYGYCSRWEEAGEKAKEVAETRAKVLGLDHTDTLGSLEYLAAILARYGRWDGATEVLQLVTERKPTIFNEIDLKCIQSYQARKSERRSSQGGTDQTETRATEELTGTSEDQQVQSGEAGAAPGGEVRSGIDRSVAQPAGLVGGDVDEKGKGKEELPGAASGGEALINDVAESTAQPVDRVGENIDAQSEEEREE